MKVSLDHTPEQVELLKAMASNDINTRIEAQDVFAALVTPVLNEVIQQATVLSNFYTRTPYDMGTNPMLPVDTYFDITDGDFLNIWSQTSAGGLGTNEPVPNVGEMPVKTYKLDSAHSFDRNYLKTPRRGLDILSDSMTRLLQEILLKKERYSYGPIVGTLANASVNLPSGARQLVFRGNAAGRFIPADFNEMLTLGKRIHTSWYGGTAATQKSGISDLAMSPEAMEQLRAMSYNPINNATAPQSAAIKDSVAAPESIRAAMFEAGDLTTFYGKTLWVFNEFGIGGVINNAFDAAAGSTNYSRPDGATGSAAFNGATEQIVIGFNRGMESLRQLVAQDDVGTEYQVYADDQFYSRRANKVGFYGECQEGRIITDKRAMIGLII